MRSRTRALLAAALIAATAAFVPSGDVQANVTASSPEFAARLERIREVVSEQMPRVKDVVSPADMQTMMEGFETAQATDDGCTAATALRQARAVLSRQNITSEASASAISSIQAAFANAELAAVSTMPAAECGGVADPQNRTPSVQVLSQSLTGFDVRVSFPVGQFEPVSAKTDTGAMFAGMRLSVADATAFATTFGAPAVPMIQLPFAVPANARVSVQTLSAETVSVPGVTLAPAQDEAADAVTQPDPFANPPFQYNADLYKSTQPVPAVRASYRPYGELRGMPMAHLRTFAARYTGSTGAVEVVRSTMLRVTFTPVSQTAPMKFANLTGAFERFAQAQFPTLLNQISLKLPSNLQEILPILARGEELLIVTSGTLKAQANDYANFERGRGYVTRVVTVGDAAIGNTNTSIQTYVRSHLNDKSGALRPSYLILFGDTDQVPTFKVATPWASTGFDGMIATDRPYGTSTNTDLVPDLAIGRLPVSDAASATALVAKLKAYINTPTMDPDYYKTATITSYFQPPTDSSGTVTSWTQDSRGFTKMAETVASFLETSASKTVQRLYTASSSANPTTYYDGTAMPASMQKPTQPWTVAPNALRDAINTGRFLTIHRDHGAPTAVSNPSLSTADFASMSNTSEPTMLWLIDCAAGMFDDPTTLSVAETAVRDDAGAIAAIGASRNSPSFTNNHLGLGMADAVWPNLLPTWGSGTATTTIGDVLTAGKNYMASRSGSDGATAATVAAEWDLYNLFGDPTFPIRKFRPVQFTFTSAAWLSPSLVRINASPGVDATLMDGNGNAVARGLVGKNGVLDVQVPVTVGGGRLMVVVGRPEAVPVKPVSLLVSSRPVA